MRPSAEGIHGLPEKWCSPSEIPRDRWFWYGRVWNGDYDEHRYAVTYDFMMLSLPSWGYFYDVRYDEDRWGQRVLLWHGRKGFYTSVRFPDGN